MQLLLSLDNLNRKSIIHRDLKPDNILLSSSTELTQADVYLADFGFAAVY
jgi:serine/threonine protein kinase